MWVTIAGMNMLFRTIWLIVRSALGPRIDLYAVVRTRFRVGVGDLDVYGHMNNGVYLSILDLGRLDLMIRSGGWRALLRRGWYPVVVAQSVAYRESLRFARSFTLETRILGFDERDVYVEQRFVLGGQIAARAFVRARFLCRGGGAVRPEDLCTALGVPPEGRTVPPWLLEWAATTALPSRRTPAPSNWTEERT